jgi:hypothetical protein
MHVSRIVVVSYLISGMHAYIRSECPYPEQTFSRHAKPTH